MKIYNLLFITLFALQINSQTIDSVRALGVGSTVTFTGIVTNGDELGTIRYVQDSTAAIAVYSSNMTSTDRGDEVTVTGELKDYNGLLEVDPVSSYNVNSSGNALPDPIVITPSQLGESNEAQLVKIENVNFTTSGSFSSNTSYTFSNGSESAEIYIRSNHPLVGELIPAGTVDLIGISSQYTDYQLIIRDTNDIVNKSDLYFTSILEIENLSTTGFDLNWTVSKASTSYIKYGNTASFELGTMSSDTNTTSHSVSFTGANASEIFYVQAFAIDSADTAQSLVQVFITQSNSSGITKTYFTRSIDSSYATGTYAQFINNAIDDTVIAYINRATESIDLCIYSFNEGSSSMSDVPAALNAAYNKGVKIRVIYAESTTSSAIAYLDSGIPVLQSNNPDGLMHDKFMVIDAHSSDPNVPILWTGSTNLTQDQINTDANNCLFIQDQSLAKAYELEFHEMWGDTGMVSNGSAAKFGSNKEDNTPHEFIIGGNRVELYFSPSDGTNNKIIEAIENADTDFYIATMLITRTDIGYAIQDQVAGSVEGYCILNSEGESSSTVISILQSDLADNFVLYDTEEGVLHHKYMIVDPNNPGDDPIVLTGSHNWSNAANNENDENTLIIHDTTLANIYYQEFMARYYLNKTTDIIESGDNVQLKIFPNPSDGKFSIYDYSGTLNGSEVIVTDVLGKIIWNDILEDQILDVNLGQQYKAGYYSVIIVKDNVKYSKKLLLQ